MPKILHAKKSIEGDCHSRCLHHSNGLMLEARTSPIKFQKHDSFHFT